MDIGDIPQLLHFKVTTIYVVLYASGGADDDVHSFSQLCLLCMVWSSTVKANRCQPACFAYVIKVCMYLLRQHVYSGFI